MKKKLRVGVLMGGKSPEHQISLASGKQVLKYLNHQKYQALPIILPSNGNIENLLKHKKNIDLAFIAMHGTYGEDGSIQGMLELMRIPYTGSPVLASALAIHKIASKKLFIASGLTAAEYFEAKKGEKIPKMPFSYPVFVKPNNQGSSIGVTLVTKKEKLKMALQKAWEYSNVALIEEYIKGIEITAPVLGNENPKVLPLIEIVPKNDFFDYEAKYTESKCDEICPARISKNLAKNIEEAAVIAYKALWCRGFARIDLIVRENEIFILEVNTIPGLTPVSLFPKAAKVAGISYPKLLDQIISFSIKK